MKKRFLVSVLFVVIVLVVFGDPAEQEEVDFLLFLPNSGSLVVNEERAMVQLDNLAKYLTGRELIPGQIYVYGYAAFAVNDIDSISLSRDRALWVINELQKRGVPGNLFSDPVGHGSVDLWGSNTDEEGRSPNRRVRIMLDDIVLTPQTLSDAGSASPDAGSASPDAEPEAPAVNMDNDEAPFKFPWWILLLLLLPLILFLLKKKKNTDGATTKPAEIVKPAPVPDPVPAPAPEIASAAVEPPAAVPTFTVNLEEEIRIRAYEQHLRRNGYSENPYEDWCIAVHEICAKYEANGYQVFNENGNWWARKSGANFER